MATALCRLGDRRLLVLPPRGLGAPAGLNSNYIQGTDYARSISDIQRFREAVYVRDRVLSVSTLDSCSHDQAGSDYKSWHFVIATGAGEICGCIRMQFYPPTADLSTLHLHACLSRAPADRVEHLHAGVQSFRQTAYNAGLRFGEVGGWAVSEEFRRSSTSILLPITVWAMCRILGDASILATATTRHQSAAILQRIGGFVLPYNGIPVDGYFDSYFGCEMEILGFDSRQPSAKYAELVAETRRFMVRDWERGRLGHSVAFSPDG
jgi:hypothetical protein